MITGQRVSLPGRKEPPGHTGCHPKTTCHQPQLRANQPSAEPAGRYCGARHPGSRHHPVTSPSTPARSGPQQSLGPRAADAPAPRVCTAAPRPAHAGFPGHAGPALPLPGGLSGATPGRTGFGQPVPSVLLESSPVQGQARTERAQVSAAEAGVPSSRLDPGRVGGHMGHSAPGGLCQRLEMFWLSLLGGRQRCCQWLAMYWTIRHAGELSGLNVQGRGREKP